MEISESPLGPTCHVSVMEKNNLSAVQRNTNKVKVTQQANFILKKKCVM